MQNDNAIKTQYKYGRQGFTLLETLVAIAVLLIAVVGPMSAIGGALSQIGTARDQMIALNLAQEGIEIVRQKRDSNMIACWGDPNWGTTLTSCATWGSGLIAGNYIINVATQSLTPVGSDTKVYLNGGLYTQGVGSTATQYSRTVNITDASSEKMITSTVTWSVGGVLKKIEVKESIFGINL